jgi:hypothetical protein
MSHIFISYARKDSACVDQVVNRLEAQGLPVWIDKYNIPGGEWWGPAIQEGVRHAAAILVFWSQNARDSEHVRDEITWALQQKAQNPSRNLQIIPVLLEAFATAPLPDNLKGLSAVDLTDCESYEPFKQLLRRLLAIDTVHEIGRRLTTNFDKSKPLKDLPDAKSIDTNLWIVPVMQSVHSMAYLVGNGDTSLLEHLEHNPKKLQLCFLMKGSLGDNSFLGQVKEFIGDDFLALYITPKPDGGVFELNNQRQGQWLDIVNTSHEVALQVVGRGGARLQLFSLAPAVLTFAMGTRFYEYWHIQFFNRVGQTYLMVIDNRDLPFKT